MGSRVDLSYISNFLHIASELLWLLQVEGHLEEMVRLAKSSEQYNQYMMGSMQDVMGAPPLDASVEERFRSGQFSAKVRELVAYYIAMVSSSSTALFACCEQADTCTSCQISLMT